MPSLSFRLVSTTSPPQIDSFRSSAVIFWMNLFRYCVRNGVMYDSSRNIYFSFSPHTLVVLFAPTLSKLERLLRLALNWPIKRDSFRLLVKEYFYPSATREFDSPQFFLFHLWKPTPHLSFSLSAISIFTLVEIVEKKREQKINRTPNF